MTPRICEHVKPNGTFCGSPALRGRDYCFFHLNCLGRKLQRQKAAQLGDATPLELPPLENADAIQVALMQVTQAILDGRLDRKRAGLVLYALQTASSNLRYTKFGEVANRETVCRDYDSLEEDYEIVEYAPELRTAKPKYEELTDLPNLESYTDDELTEAFSIVGVTDNPAPVDAAMKEDCAKESDPEQLKQRLRIAWACVDVVKARQWIARQQQKEQQEQDPDAHYVMEKSAQPQSLLFGLKKPPLSVVTPTAADDRATQAG